MDADLILACATLRRSAPQQWEQFVAAFAKHFEKRKVELVQAAPDSFFQTQGRAQEIAHLLKGFEECIQRAARLEQK